MIITIDEKLVIGGLEALLANTIEDCKEIPLLKNGNKNYHLIQARAQLIERIAHALAELQYARDTFQDECICDFQDSAS